MIKARATDGTIIFGLDKENIERLTNGEHLLVAKDELGLEANVVIVYGETIEQLMTMLGVKDEEPAGNS